jgi:hypothetical protein
MFLCFRKLQLVRHFDMSLIFVFSMAERQQCFYASASSSLSATLTRVLFLSFQWRNGSNVFMLPQAPACPPL